MKEATANYITAETSTERQPIEIYTIWVEGIERWDYTSSDTEVEYDGITYEPAALSRGVTEWDAELSVSKMTVTIDYLHNIILQYVGENPVDTTWISIRRLWRDYPSEPAGVIFVGQIKSVSFKGVTADLECVGFEYYFEKSIPTFRYQSKCNWKVFDNYCKLDTNASLAYRQYGTVVEISEDRLTLTVDHITQDQDYYALGILQFGNYARMITESASYFLKIRYPIATLEVGDTVLITAGCDGKLETCLDKYNNVVNFGGHPYIPEDNPSTWS